MRSDRDPSLEPVPDDPRGGFVDLPLFATAEEVAYAEQLAALDRAEDAALRAEWDAAGYDGLESDGGDWDEALAELADDDALVERLSGPAHAADLMLLDSVDPGSLRDPHAKVRCLQGWDRMAAFVAAGRARAVVALAGESSSEAYLPEIHLEQEIAVARRTSRYSAGQTIERSRALATTFPGFAAALRAGEISEVHCAILVERTRVVSDPDTLTRIEARVLPKARRLTPGQFAGEVAKAIALLDRDAASRVRKARESRRVWVRQLEDGLGVLGLIHDWPTIESIKRQVTADGRALQLQRRASAAVTEAEAAAAADAACLGAGLPPADTDQTVAAVAAPDQTVAAEAAPDQTVAVVGEVEVDDEDATADICRADAFAARILGTPGDDGSVTWDRSETDVVVNVVMDLDTLRGEADRVALLDGQPVPGEIGREVARFASWWRRLVTDPVDGHLLDYGRAQYLPEKLRRFVFARDAGCRAPYCTVHAEARLQLDHVQEWPDGESSTANTGALCTTCDQLKTAGFAEFTDSRPDGSCTWRTAWGQTIHVPPRPVLDDPDPPPAEPEPPQLEPVPF